MNREINISTTTSEKEYIRFCLYNVYCKPTGIFITALGLVFTGLLIRFFLNKDYEIHDWPVFQILFTIYIIIGMPLFTYLLGKKYYKQSAFTKGKLKYNITDERLEITGEQYKSDLSWNLIPKVEETRDSFLVYMAKQNAHILPKRNFTNDEITIFKQIVQQANVKHKFKTNS